MLIIAPIRGASNYVSLLRALSAVWVTALAIGPAVAEAAFEDDRVERAIVSIQVTQQRSDWYSPWQRTRPKQSSGSGFLIGPGRIMTNAHVVSDARQIIVRRNQDPRPYFAQIEFIAHDSDLATLKVPDTAFGRGVKPLEVGNLPSLRSRVRTYGYPAGGEKISRTEGVVSRIEFITYRHSGADEHLGIQTDSAINPGNSGGPVIQEGQVIGVAFQINPRLNDVGYFIPSPVIRRFLNDISDGGYDGYGDLGIVISNLINPSYRKFLGLHKDMMGVVVDRILPGASADGFVFKNDVITAIDDVPIMTDGTIDYYGYSLNFEQIAEEKQIGESVKLTLWRDGKLIDIHFPLRAFEEADRMRSQFDTLPRYFVFAGLVFMELNREYLKSFGNYWENADKHLLYAHFFSFMESEKGFEDYVILARILPHGINSAYAGMVNYIVNTLNGVPIRKLEDLELGLRSSQGAFHRFELSPGELVLVLDKEKAAKAHPEILTAYGIDKDRRL